MDVASSIHAPQSLLGLHLGAGKVGCNGGLGQGGGKTLKSAGNLYRKAAGIACIFLGLKHAKIRGNSSSGFA